MGSPQVFTSPVFSPGQYEAILRGLHALDKEDVPECTVEASAGGAVAVLEPSEPAAPAPSDRVGNLGNLAGKVQI